MQRKWKTRMQRAWLINPGWSLPALEYLYEQRKIAALGYETTHTDPGIAYDSRRLLAGNLHLEHETLSDRSC